MYINECVNTLTDAQKHELIKNYIQFEKDGYIGDCFLREKAEHLDKSGNLVIMTMREIAFCCYVYFYEKNY
jgi:hypothetical protein